MATTKKAIELSAELADELKKRVSAGFVSIVESSDSNGDPVITLSDGTPAAGEQVAIIRTKAMPWTLATDVLGLAAGRYTPHIMEICLEGVGAAGTSAPILTSANLLPLLATVAKRGTQVDLYITATTVVPSISGSTMAGTLGSSYQPELYWGMLAMQ